MPPVRSLGPYSTIVVGRISLVADYAVFLWVDDVKERQHNVVWPYCTLCNGNPSECAPCVAKIALHVKNSPQILWGDGSRPKILDTAPSLQGLGTWTAPISRNLDSANIILDDLDMEIRIPVTVLDKRNELD